MATGLFNLKQVNQAIQQGAWATGTKPTAVDYLVVAGGGGSGYNWGSPGGAGGLLQGGVPVASGSSITVTVGAGGTIWSNGSNSVFGSIASTGGGAGGGGATAAYSGGSGGGASVGAGGNGYGFGLGIPGQGNNGGRGWTGGGGATGNASGGGGGAGTRGADVSVAGYGALGGSGIVSAITGTATTYAAGGNGSGNYGANSDTTGGRTASGTAGAANTGSGAGSGDYIAGGSGIVIVSYPDVYAAPTATTGSPTVSTSGSGSIYFDGTGDYLTVPDNSAWAFGSGNFTIEAWIYRTVNTVTQMIVAQSDNSTAAGSAWTFYVLNSNKLVSNVYYGSSYITLTSSADVPSNAWVHVALVRTSGTVSQYINGSRDGTSSSLSTNSLNDVGQTVGIGANNAGNDRFTGYFSNVRIIKGSGPYDATASTLTVPTAPLTAITNTQLMLNTVSGALFADASTNSFTITRNGDVTWNALSPFTVTGYKNRVYKWTSSGSITF
jgi:hypothetical protein